jgi:hypothetical protein
VRDSKPRVDLEPLAKALEYASRALGFDAWELMKDWARDGKLSMRGRADGVTMDFEPHWFDFLAKWGPDKPTAAGTPAISAAVDTLDEKIKLASAPRLISPRTPCISNVPLRSNSLKALECRCA